MKKIFVKAVAAVAMMCVAMPAMAQFNLKKAVRGCRKYGKGRDPY